MEAHVGLDMSVETEITMEGLDLFRAEIHDGYGNLVDCSKWTTSPVRATRTGSDLLDHIRSERLAREAHNEAVRLFTPAA